MAQIDIFGIQEVRLIESADVDESYASNEKRNRGQEWH
jgi:hypothetical protein